MVDVTWSSVFEVAILVYQGIFNVLDSNGIGGYTLLDITLAILFLIALSMMVLSYLDIEVDLWGELSESDEFDELEDYYDCEHI